MNIYHSKKTTKKKHENNHDLTFSAMRIAIQITRVARTFVLHVLLIFEMLIDVNHGRAVIRK